MITPEFVKTLAKYNRWQNESIFQAASTLSVDERKLDRGAFFGSIHATLSHLLWGDQIWMQRFAGTRKPAVSSIAESAAMVDNWNDLQTQRHEFDKQIVKWSKQITPEFLAGDLQWFSGALKKDVRKPTGMLVAHMFNHQTHHRGQVHAMITAAGANPDDTDLFAMPED